MGDSVGSSFTLIIILVLVLVAAYFTTRFLSVHSKRLTKGASMKLLDQMALSRDKHVVLLKVGEKGYIIGVTNQGMNVIGTMEKKELAVLEQDSGEPRVLPNINGFFRKFRDFIKNASGAQEKLREARMQARQAEKEAWSAERDGEDEIEQLISAVKDRKNRFGGGGSGDKS